jgi:hypothetical protein
MSSSTQLTNMWLERCRLAGMVLGAVSYGAIFAVDKHNSKVDSCHASHMIGVFLLLTIQSLVALTQRPRYGAKIADYRPALISYIIITFILGTISTAANAKFTEMIWIDLRDTPGGPLRLIEYSLEYRINVWALCW